MMNFKERKESRLEAMRNKRLKEEAESLRRHSVELKKRKSQVEVKGPDGSVSHRSVPLSRRKSEAEINAFFKKLSMENLKK